VEVILPLEMVHDLEGARQLAQELAKASRQEQHIGEVDVLFR
jgi:hypothetical protein